MKVSEIFLSGVPASEGMAAGALVQHQLRRSDLIDRQVGNPQQEQYVLQQALDQARTEISKLMARLDQTATEIMEFQLALLEDEDFLAPVSTSINKGKSAHEAWTEMVNTEISDYVAADESYMVARADDLIDLKRCVLAAMSGNIDTEPSPTHSEGVVIAACEIMPSEFLELDLSSISAIATSGGSPSSHVAILARARGIPMLVGCDSELLKVPSGSAALVDTDLSQIIVNPQKDRHIAFQSRLSQHRNLEKRGT